MVDVVRHCCPCPRYRLLSLRTLPQVSVCNRIKCCTSRGQTESLSCSELLLGQHLFSIDLVNFVLVVVDCAQLPQQALQWEGRQRWRPMLCNLRQMLLADSLIEQRANWHIGAGTPSPDLGSRGAARENVTLVDSEPPDSSVNRSCASMVFLRGDLSADELSSVLRTLCPFHDLAFVSVKDLDRVCGISLIV